MPGMRKEFPKEETYNKYGDAARKIEIGAIENTELLYESPFLEFRNGVTEREGRFVYAMGDKPIKAGHKRAGSYIDESRKLDARFCVGRLREYAARDTSTPTIQLPSLMI